MKKVLLFTMLFSLQLAFSQTTVWSDDFNDEDITDWTAIDSDGDGFDWVVVQIQDNEGNPVDTPMLRSQSWVGGTGGGPLTPDNWIISPAIDLTGASGEIMLNYQVKASDADWDAENYTVYVASSDDPANLLASSYSFSETTLDGVNSLADRSLDVSGLAGNTIYVAFRHYNVSDQFTMEIDNVEVTAETLSVNDVALARTTAVYPNPAKDMVNVRLAEDFDAAKTTVTLTNVSGKQVASFASVEELNVAKLPAGVYVMTITDGNKTESKKLIKK